MARIPIVQGEHAVGATADTLISTVLGSCIAACLRDGEARIGGMNHFLLGEPTVGQKLSEQEMARYGIHAMEVLINALMSRGADRSRLRAQIYGGANVVARLGEIGQRNIEFTRRFLSTEKIPVTFEDVGGRFARRVEFLPYEGKARCHRVGEAPDVKPVLLSRDARVRSGEVELF